MKQTPTVGRRIGGATLGRLVEHRRREHIRRKEPVGSRRRLQSCHRHMRDIGASVESVGCDRYHMTSYAYTSQRRASAECRRPYIFHHIRNIYRLKRAAAPESHRTDRRQSIVEFHRAETRATVKRSIAYTLTACRHIHRMQRHAIPERLIADRFEINRHYGHHLHSAASGKQAVGYHSQPHTRLCRERFERQAVGKHCLAECRRQDFA